MKEEEKIIEATEKTLDTYSKTFKDLAEYDKGGEEKINERMK